MTGEKGIRKGNVDREKGIRKGNFDKGNGNELIAKKRKTLLPTGCSENNLKLKRQNDDLGDSWKA